MMNEACTKCAYNDEGSCSCYDPKSICCPYYFTEYDLKYVCSDYEDCDLFEKTLRIKAPNNTAALNAGKQIIEKEYGYHIKDLIYCVRVI